MSLLVRIAASVVLVFVA